MFVFLSIGGSPGSADLLLEGTTSGDGTLDHEINGAAQSSRVMAYKSEGIEETYRKVETDKVEYADSSSTLDVSVSMDNAGGTRRTKFVFRQKGAGVGQNIEFHDAKGAFSADAVGYLGVSDDGTVSFDMTYAINGSSLGFEAIIIDARTGKQITLDRLAGIGKFNIQRHLNVTTPVSTPESWLGSCEDMNKDIYNDPTIAGSIFVMPVNNSRYNYYAKNRKVYSVLNSTGDGA